MNDNERVESSTTKNNTASTIVARSPTLITAPISVLVDRRSTQNNSTSVIVADSPTQNNIPSVFVDGSTTIINASSSVIAGSSPTQNIPTTVTQVAGGPTQNNTPQSVIVASSSTPINASVPPTPTSPIHNFELQPGRSGGRRRRHNRKIKPRAIPTIPPPRSALLDAQDENMNRLIDRMGNINCDDATERGKLATFGDVMTADAAWPNPGTRKYIRIFLINTNGISYYNNFLEWEMSLGFLYDMQIDIFGITEPNLDFSQASVRYDVQEKARQVDKFMDINLSASSHNTKLPGRRTPFKMGGTITGVNGGWSGRKHSSGRDPLNRWTWTTLNGQSGKKFTVITVYRPCISSGQGTCTIHLQHTHDLLAHGIQNPNPRKQLLTDLGHYVTSLHEKGHTVLVMGDMNSDVQNDPDILAFLQDNQLQNTLLTRHNDTTLPASYDRGRVCVEIMALSSTVPPQHIQKSGMLPFYFNFASDHRGFYCDISTEWLFSRISADTTKSTMRRFTTSRVPRCEKYLNKLEQLMEQSNIFEAIDRLELQFQQSLSEESDIDIDPMIMRCKTLFNKVTEFMKCAERNCGAVHYQDGFPHSKAISSAAEQVFSKKKKARILSLRNLPGDDELVTLAKSELAEAFKNLRKAQRSSVELRREYLEDLIQKRSEEWNMDPCEALFIIQEAESSRKRHSKHKLFMKQQMGGTLRRLLVPAPCTGTKNNIRDQQQYYNIEDPDQIFDILLQRNFTALQRSKESIFASGPFSERLGLHGEGTKFYDDLLNGNVDPASFDSHYPQFTGELSPFITALRSKVKEGDQSFQWEFGVKEFKATFKKTRESTACGPSSLHMSHFKAAVERNNIARVHAFFIWAAFRFGFSYERWETSWHCMLQKMKDPYVDKLRIIQLFEGDFNAGLKYFLGKLLMQHITQLQYTDSETYGSRIGKSATEALITLQTLFSHTSTWTTPVAMIFNDAAGCYDRIPLILAELAAVGSGCSKSIMKCHTTTQRKMKHYVKTAAGVSTGYITFNANYAISTLLGFVIFQGLIGGIGQGGGGGPILWLLVSTIMIQALRRLSRGAEMAHVLGWMKLMLWIVSYVDDNTLLRTFPIGTSSTVVIQELTKMMTHWHRLLQITGGDLCLEKCKLSILVWNNNNLWGLPKASTIEEFPGNVSMGSDLDLQHPTVQLERIEPWVGERILGVRASMTGNMDTELDFRINQSKTMANDLRKAPFDPHDAWMVYESRYRAALRFPLPVTTFDSEQCHRIQQPFIYQLLGKLGLNRHTPRAIIYGPKRLGGLQLMDLRCEQPHLHYLATLGHIRRQDQAGQGLLINISDLQAEIGSAQLVFSLDRNRYNYGTENTRMQYLWTLLHEHNCTLEGWEDWVPSPVGCNDKNIMDTAVHDPYFANKYNYRLKVINACRLYLGAVFLSDLTQNGKIPPHHLDGSTFTPNPQVHRTPRLKPSTAAWTEWKNFIFRNFLIYGYNLAHPIEPSPLRIEALTQRPKEIDIVMNMHQFHQGENLETLVSLLPHSLRQLLGNISYPRDNGATLAQHISNHTAYGATDGSLIHSFDSLYGGHAATIQQEHSDAHSFTISAPSPHSTGMSSTTTELFAFITAVILVHLVTIAHSITSGSITIYIDNQEAGKAGSSDLDLINIGDYLIADYDLAVLLRQLLTKSPATIEYAWVKSHQDELPTGEIIHGPFLRHVQLNREVDALAAIGRNSAEHTIVKRPVFSSTGLQIYTPDGTAITDWGQYLLDTTNGDTIKQYYRERRGWTNQHLRCIDWEAISIFLNKQQHTKRMKILQLQHGWQNTGSQKLNFLLSSLQDDAPTEETKIDKEVYCPFDCHTVEEQLHYMTCSSAIMTTKRRQLRQRLLQRLRMRRTSPMILSILSYILVELDASNEPEFQESWQHTEEQPIVRLLFQHQELIGWTSILQGFITIEWSLLQQRYVRRHPKLFDPSNNTKKQKSSDTLGIWKRYMVSEIIQYTLDCWQYRNDQLHGSLEHANRQLHHRQLLRRIRTLYCESTILTRPEDRKYFRMPCKLRVKQKNIVRLETWANMVELVLRQHREREARVMNDPWHRQGPGLTHGSQ